MTHETEPTLPGLVVVNTFQNGRTPEMISAWANNKTFGSYIDRAAQVVGHGVATDWRAQAALVVFGVGAFYALQHRLKHRPEIATGHSIGENSIWVQSGAAEYEPMVDLVNRRDVICATTKTPDQLAQTGMAALMRLSPEEVIAKLEAAAAEQLQVWLANINDSSQTVLSGLHTHMERFFATHLAPLNPRARLIKLPLPGCFHSDGMEEEEKRFKPEAQRILGSNLNDPNLVVYSPMQMARLKSSQVSTGEQVRVIIDEQLTCPLDFRGTWQDVLKGDVRAVVALDPSGKVETMVRGNNGERNLPVFTVKDPKSLEETVEGLKIVYKKELRKVS